MHPGKAVRTVVFIVTTVYTVVLTLEHATLASCASRVLAAVPTAVGYGLLVFDQWVWRFPIIHRLVGRPHIAGTWLGTLEPSAGSKMPDGGNHAIQSALVIEQSYWSISLTLMTAEGSSRSTSAAIRTDAENNSGRRTLAYSYANQPDQKHLARSPAHLGAANLHVVGRSPREIRGSYWTNRFTAGDMTFRFVTREVDFPTLDAVITAATEKGLI